MSTSQLDAAETITDSNGDIIKQVFALTGGSGTRILATYTNDIYQASIEGNGQVLLAPAPFSSFEFGKTVGISAFAADLNRDGKPDFILHSYSGGCGRVVCFCDAAFILSNHAGYTLTTVSTLWDDKNLISLDGKIFVVHADVYPVEECLDGDYHFFWTYNLLEIDNSAIKLNNSALPGFPKTLDEISETGFNETTLLSDEKKQKMQKWVENSIFWKYQTTARREARRGQPLN